MLAVAGLCLRKPFANHSLSQLDSPIGASYAYLRGARTEAEKLRRECRNDIGSDTTGEETNVQHCAPHLQRPTDSAIIKAHGWLKVLCRGSRKHSE